MKLLTGSQGFIGRNLKELLPPMLCPTHKELDLTDKIKVKEYLSYYKPEQIIHCASSDKAVCLYDNLQMFVNLAESKIPMATFCTGLEEENRKGWSGEYVLSKKIIRELAIHKYKHIAVFRIWGCFGKYESASHFFMDNMLRIKKGKPILVKENKMFSYVYVKDLAKLVYNYMNLVSFYFLKNVYVCNRLINAVGYTQSLYYYARILKRITGSSYDIIVKKDDMLRSYTGQNSIRFNYTPLGNAIKEVWENVR